jgi:hypothetical protein
MDRDASRSITEDFKVKIFGFRLGRREWNWGI